MGSNLPPHCATGDTRCTVYKSSPLLTADGKGWASGPSWTTRLSTRRLPFWPVGRKTVIQVLGGDEIPLLGDEADSSSKPCRLSAVILKIYQPTLSFFSGNIASLGKGFGHRWWSTMIAATSESTSGPETLELAKTLTHLRMIRGRSYRSHRQWWCREHIVPMCSHQCYSCANHLC